MSNRNNLRPLMITIKDPIPEIKQIKKDAVPEDVAQLYNSVLSEDSEI